VATNQDYRLQNHKQIIYSKQDHKVAYVWIT